MGKPGKLPPDSPQRYRGPLRTFIGGGSHSNTAKLLVMMVIPGSALFLFAIALLQAGHTTLTLLFFVGYLICALLQVGRERKEGREREVEGIKGKERGRKEGKGEREKGGGLYTLFRISHLCTLTGIGRRKGGGRETERERERC